MGVVSTTAAEPCRWWARDPDEVVTELGSDSEHGLGSGVAEARLLQAGANVLVGRSEPGRWRRLARQLGNTMTAVLAVAAVVTVAIGDLQDAVVIAVIVVLNTAVGFAQESRAARAMALLRQLTTGEARVVRDGRVLEVPTPELVPGDVIELATGDLVPADVRLLAVHGLRVDEAALTGESEPVTKSAATVRDRDAPVAERFDLAFRGTAVTAGRARGIVVATGMETELGQIAALLQAPVHESTPLQRRLAVLGRKMAAAAVVVCTIVFLAGVARGEAVEDMFLTSVSLAVAAIPEGLPAVVTISLALGARRMAERNAVIRRLPAVETLGSVSVICTDKTGTLTQNRMLVERVWTAAGTYEVSGAGYAPDGAVRGGRPPEDDDDLRHIGRVVAACNDARLHRAATDAEWRITGDPTEGSLLALASKVGVEREDLARQAPRIAEIGFDGDRRRMTTVHRCGDGYWIATKGALHAIAPLLRDEDRALAGLAEVAANALADDGARVLAVAERFADTLQEPLEQVERGLHLLGLVAISDPPRAEAADAVRRCHSAGIRPVMITGDHPRTARAIARRLGIVAEDDGRRIVDGVELDGLDDAALRERVVETGVFARTSPAQKLRIVEAWRARGAIVAMTGDGVNDAPALQAADIGVAMGRIGTDVSKEAADLVLADDDFATIVHAVEEGRRIHDSVRRFVRYLLTSNSGEIWVMFLAPLVGLPLPLLPVQILWINLVTDGPPAIALGLEPAEPDTMQRPPRAAQESILAGGLWQHAAGVGLLMAAVVLPLQALARAADWPWQTMVFTTVALLQLGHALAVRSERRSLLALGHRSNPWIGWSVAGGAAAQLATVYVPVLQRAFRTEALAPLQLVVVLVASSTALVAVEVEKALRRRVAGA